MNNLYWVAYQGEEWGVLVVDTTARAAKRRFTREGAFYDWAYGKYTDLRVNRLERDVEHAPGVYEDPGEPEWVLEYYCTQDKGCTCRRCRSEQA
jgi:hypothetical protein